MSGMNVRKLSDSLLKGMIKGMGPAGLPASMLLDFIDVMMESQKKETEVVNAPSIAEITNVVRQEVRKQAARDAWSKIQPACQEYSTILGNMAGGKLRPTDKTKLDELMRIQLGSSSDLRQGLKNIYDAQMSPSDMSTAEYAFPAYALGVSVEVSLMMMEVPRNARINGSIGPNDWRNVRNRAVEHADAMQRISGYIRGFVIEKQLREELAAGRFKIGSPKIQERQAELEKQLLGEVVSGAPAAVHELYQLSRLLENQEKDENIAAINEFLKKRLANQPS